MQQNLKASITGIGSYLPKKVLTNYDLEKMIDTSMTGLSNEQALKSVALLRTD